VPRSWGHYRENGYEGCGRPVNYFEAYNFAEVLDPALLSVIAGETTVKDLWPEWKADGQEYAAYLITGKMATKETYKDYVKFVG
jgi:hypothetical protein